MKKGMGQLLLAGILIILSVVIYAVHYYWFDRDPRFISDWFFGSLAFLPISILGVTIIFERLLAAREKERVIKKINMVIGAFFGEVGTRLLAMLRPHQKLSLEIIPFLIVKSSWGKKDFQLAVKNVRGYNYGIEAEKLKLSELKDLLVSSRNFLLRLLENQNLLEHETFTDLLWAVFHISDELEHRENLNKLSQPDLFHISGDIQRAYALLVVEWLSYMEHLKNNYPYLFSLAIRTNPFDPEAKVEVK